MSRRPRLRCCHVSSRCPGFVRPRTVTRHGGGAFVARLVNALAALELTMTGAATVRSPSFLAFWNDPLIFGNSPNGRAVAAAAVVHGHTPKWPAYQLCRSHRRQHRERSH